MNSYQFIKYWPRWRGLGYKRLRPDKTDMAYIYKWVLMLGFWEVRKWHKHLKGDMIK